MLCLLEINAVQLGAQAALTAVAEAAFPSKPPSQPRPTIPLAELQERRARAALPRGVPAVTLAERRAASVVKSGVRHPIPVYDVAQDSARLDTFLHGHKFEQEELCALAGKSDRWQATGGREPISWGSFRCMSSPQDVNWCRGVSIVQVLGAALSAILAERPVEVPGGVTAGVVAQAVAWVEQLTRIDSDSPEFKSLVSRILPHQPPSLPEPTTDLAHAVMVAHARANGSLPCGSVRLSDVELRMCSHSACGRIETRQHEFRRCSACGAVNYCSTVCQEHHWVARHRDQCPGMAAAMAANGVLPPGVDMEDYDMGNGGEMALTPRGGQPAVFADVDRGVEGEAMEIEEAME